MLWSRVSRLASGSIFCGIAGPGADHVVGVMAGMEDDAVDRLEVGDAIAHAEGEVDDRLALILGRMLLGVGFEDRALGLPGGRKRHGIFGVGSVEHTGDHAVLALVDRRRRALAPHGPVDGLDGELSGMRGRERLPARNLALARLPGAHRGVQRLLNRLVDRLGGKPEQRPQPRRGGRAEMRDVVDLVSVKTDALHEVDLDLVGGGDAAHQVFSTAPSLLRDGENRGNVVARMGVVGGEEGIVEVELPDRRPVRPGSPFGGEAAPRRDAEHRCAPVAGMGQRLRPGRSDRSAIERGHRHRGVVDDAVDRHVDDLGLDRDGIGRDGRDFPGELVFSF